MPSKYNNGGRLKIKFYDRRNDFIFPIVNFPFISSNITVVPTYEVYISQIKHYMACTQYSDFLDRPQLLTQKPLKHYCVALRFKKSQQKFFDRLNELIERYTISISEMAIDPLLFM